MNNPEQVFTVVVTDTDGNLLQEEEFDTLNEAHHFCLRHEDDGNNLDVRNPDDTLDGWC